MITRLRTLTRKSSLNFGKYADATIQNLLSNNETQYLRWVYYNCSNITFTDDILTEIHILYDSRIEKPGKCPEKHASLTEFLSKRRMAKLTRSGNKKEAMKMFQHNTKRAKLKAKAKRISHNQMMAIKYSKGSLAWKNQGH